MSLLLPPGCSLLYADIFFSHREKLPICFLCIVGSSHILHTSAFHRPLCMQRRMQQPLPGLCQLQSEDLHLLGCAAGENGVHQPVKNPGGWPRVCQSSAGARCGWVKKGWGVLQEKIDERLLADDMLRTRVLGTTWGGGLLTIENPCQLIFSLFCR